MADFRVSIFGAGNVGSALAAFLCADDGIATDVYDPSEMALDKLAALGLPVTLHHLRPYEDLPHLLRGADLAVAAAPEHAVATIARAAAQAKTHFLDFSPQHPSVLKELQPLAQDRVILSGCGVSPGIVENLASGLLEKSGTVTDLTIRVGSIPRYPTNRLGYGQIWDINGLIDEYTKPCEALRNGESVFLSPLENKEDIVLDGVAYEGFTTSRGLKDLSMFRAAGVRDVTFKTLRYPGHLDYMRLLLDDLGLRHRRDMLRSVLLNGLPVIEDDVLVLFLTARFTRDSRKTEASVSYTFLPNRDLGPFNAMTSVAAGHAAGLVAMLKAGKLGERGFFPHHRLPSEDLLQHSQYLAPLMRT